MQNSVIFGILITIMNSPKAVGRAYLAKKYEISERTVRRYINVLVGSGVPIRSYTGLHGGYRIPNDFSIERLYFTAEEFDRILTCLDAVGQNFDDKMNVSIRDKMTNLSIGQKKGDYVVSSKSLVIDAGSWNNPKFYRGKMAAAQEAIAGQLSVDITYIDRNDNLTERVLDPYTVVLKEGVWYVYGWCHQRKDFRLFRLSRIKSMFITDNVFTVKENNVFDKLHETLPKTHQIELTLSVKDEALSDVEEWLGIEAMTKSSAGAEFTALVYGGSELIKKLLSLGSNVKVLSPRAVAEELQVEVNRIVERYSL